MDGSWDGTWTSDIYDEAYGTLSLSNRIKIVFDGSIYNNKTIYGTDNITDILIEKDEINEVQLDNVISLVEYTITRIGDTVIGDTVIGDTVIGDTVIGDIQGTYYCHYPKDNGTFYLFRQQ